MGDARKAPCDDYVCCPYDPEYEYETWCVNCGGSEQWHRTGIKAGTPTWEDDGSNPNYPGPRPASLARGTMGLMGEPTDA